MTYNPLSAPAKKEFPKRNIARCTKNEIGDMPLVLKEASGISASEEISYWSMEYDCLDVRFGGEFGKVYFGSKLYDKNGDQLDATQRPAVNAQAFAGLGIVVFPEAPDYDESAVIGNVFELERVKFPPSEKANTAIPLAVLGPDFVVAEEDIKDFDGGNGAGTSQVTASPMTSEITESPELTAQLVEILDGVEPTKQAVRAALFEVGFGAGMTFGGAGLNGLAISGKLVAALEEAGLIVIIDGVITPA